MTPEKNHSPQVDLNDVLKLVGKTLNFSNSKERLIEKLKNLHSQINSGVSTDTPSDKNYLLSDVNNSKEGTSKSK